MDTAIILALESGDISKLTKAQLVVYVEQLQLRMQAEAKVPIVSEPVSTEHTTANQVDYSQPESVFHSSKDLAVHKFAHVRLHFVTSVMQKVGQPAKVRMSVTREGQTATESVYCNLADYQLSGCRAGDIISLHLSKTVGKGDKADRFYWNAVALSTER